MVISDLITGREVKANSIDADSWCSCIDGALTKDNYIKSMREAGFKNIEVLDEKPYLDLEQKQEQKKWQYYKKKDNKFNKGHQRLIPKMNLSILPKPIFYLYHQIQILTMIIFFCMIATYIRNKFVFVPTKPAIYTGYI